MLRFASVKQRKFQNPREDQVQRPNSTKYFQYQKNEEKNFIENFHRPKKQKYIRHFEKSELNTSYLAKENCAKNVYTFGEEAQNLICQSSQSKKCQKNLILSKNFSLSTRISLKSLNDFKEKQPSSKELKQNCFRQSNIRFQKQNRQPLCSLRQSETKVLKSFHDISHCLSVKLQQQNQNFKQLISYLDDQAQQIEEIYKKFIKNAANIKNQYIHHLTEFKINLLEEFSKKQHSIQSKLKRIKLVQNLYYNYSLGKVQFQNNNDTEIKKIIKQTQNDCSHILHPNQQNEIKTIIDELQFNADVEKENINEKDVNLKLEFIQDLRQSCFEEELQMLDKDSNKFTLEEPIYSSYPKFIHRDASKAISLKQFRDLIYESYKT